MVIRKDKMGRTPTIGDRIVHSKYYNGSTDLMVSKVLGFSKLGNPRVRGKYANYPWHNGNKTFSVRAEFVIL